jgi:hypothetical protein
VPFCISDNSARISGREIEIAAAADEGETMRVLVVIDALAAAARPAEAGRSPRNSEWSAPTFQSARPKCQFAWRPRFFRLNLK